MAIFTLAQTFYYPKPKDQRLSLYNRIALPLIGLAVLAYGIVVKYSSSLETLDFIYAVSYVKVGDLGPPFHDLVADSNLACFHFLLQLYITFTKYVPQAWLNYTRQSSEPSTHSLFIARIDGN